MGSFKDPSFQDRIGSAAEAKKKALERLRSKPPVDENLVAERRAARLKRDEAAVEKRIAKKLADETAKQARAAAEQEKVTAPAPPTEAERKAARDARYAARKARR
jgi:hypothetical protein